MDFKQALFSGPPRVVEKVSTPAGETHVRTLTCQEKDALDVAHAQTKDGHLRARWVIACCCDQHGSPLFDEFDLVRISELPVRTVEPIVDAALRLNRAGPEDLEAVRKN